MLTFLIPCLAGHYGSAGNKDQRSSRLQAFDVIAGGWPAHVAILEAQLGIVKTGKTILRDR